MHATRITSLPTRSADALYHVEIKDGRVKRGAYIEVRRNAWAVTQLCTYRSNAAARGAVHLAHNGPTGSVTADTALDALYLAIRNLFSALAHGPS